MHDLINQIIDKFPNIQRRAYEDEFLLLYGMLWEANIVTEELKNEILYIEGKRIEEKHYLDFKESPTPIDFVEKYSNLAFWLAKEHCLNKKTFKVASQLSEVFLEVVQADFLTNDEKRSFRKEISETQLDFLYASGNDRFCSFRIAPYIRAQAIWVKKGLA